MSAGWVGRNKGKVRAMAAEFEELLQWHLKSVYQFLFSHKSSKVLFTG